MDRIDLEQWTEHDAWATARVGKAIQAAGLEGSKAHQILAHYNASHLVWQDRIAGRSARIEPWPQVPFEKIQALAEQVTEGYRELTTGAELDLDRKAAYTNTKGQSFENTVRDILTHAFQHAAYHRGQINAFLRAEGHQPIVVDYIAFRR